jgi:hypothetical protein
MAFVIIIYKYFIFVHPHNCLPYHGERYCCMCDFIFMSQVIGFTL